MTISSARPTPLREVARYVSLILGGIGAVLSFAFTSGAISAGQAEAITAGLSSADILMAAINGLVTAGVGIAGAFTVARNGESKVTPVEAPAMIVDSKLVPLKPVTVPE